MTIVFRDYFVKDFKKLPPKIQEKFYERLKIFKKDQLDQILSNHALQGKYLNHRSINITGDIRAVFKKIGDEIHFVAIGSHSKLYG